LKSHKTLIIAEAGVNHNGSLDLAKNLVDAASQAGADVVKFQTFKAVSLVTENATKATYQMEKTTAKESQFTMLKRLELSFEMHQDILTFCKKKKIRFASTGFDLKSIDFLVDLGLDFLKIPSGEITNLPHLRHVGAKNLPIILSTGMATLKEVEEALKILEGSGANRNQITVLHCNTEYPTPMEDVNLRAMLTVKEELGVNIGYSDHTLGIEVPIAAVAMGATVIEKHFTLDRKMEGPDHAASLEPNELKEMVMGIRNIEKALGDGVKRPSASEEKNIPIARKSIVASRSIEKGELLSVDNLAVKRPGTGISPMRWNEIINLKAEISYVVDQQIEP
jgi:N,N'-diacetyllegionaminate synthase